MIELTDYQEVAESKIIEAFKKAMVALVVMASGLGKTIVAAFFAKRELKKRRRGLFLCHDTGILDQAIREFRNVLGRKAILKTFYGQGPDKDWNADKADIVFASFQTLASEQGIPFHKNEFDFVIVDESHHSQACTYKRVLSYFKPKKLLGITATPDRMDEKDIREIYGDEVVNYSLEQAIAEGWLTQVEYHILNDNLKHWKLKKILKEILEKGRRVSVKQINESIFIEKRDQEIAGTIQDFSGATKQAIIFCENVYHAENFAKFIPGSKTYHSKKSVQENRKILNAFREGNLQYIISVDKFNEGIDIPHAEIVVFLRCTDSKVVFYQQLGRGLRKILGKEKVIVLDFVANCERLVMVKEMVEKIKNMNGGMSELSKDLIHIEGKSFDFIFSDEQVEIFDVIRRIQNRVIAEFPQLFEEYAKENILPPEEAPVVLRRKYLWRCSVCDHKWWSLVKTRLANKTGCPACAGLVPKPSDYLPIAKPSLLAYYSANNPIPPDKVDAKGIFTKYVWICSKCKGEYRAALYKVIRGLPRPKCKACLGKEAERNERRQRKKESENRKKYYRRARYALKAAILAGAKDWESYRKIARKKDKRLPPYPNTFYQNQKVLENRSFFEVLNTELKKRKEKK